MTKKHISSLIVYDSFYEAVGNYSGYVTRKQLDMIADKIIEKISSPAKRIAD